MVMTEPVVTGLAITRGVVGVLRQLVPVTKSVKRISTPDLRWLSIGEGPAAVRLTQSQMASLNSFLADPNVRPFIQLTCILLASPRDPQTDGQYQAFGQHFRTMAIRWGLDHEDWSKDASAIWPVLTERLITILPKHLPTALLEDVERVIGSTSAGLVTPEAVTTVTLQVAEILSNLHDLTKCRAAATSLRDIASKTSLGMFTHITTEDIPIDRGRLFITRQLLISGESRESAETHFETSPPFRTVILGTPGAGKSTLVEHLARSGATNDNLPPLIIVRCRDYAASHWDESISDAILRTIRGEYQLELDGSVHASLLALGEIGVIFDGFDEILEPERRQLFATRVSRFAQAYPHVSLLVTSRKVGYSRAPLDNRLFAHVELEEFTSDQIRDYSHRWFSEIGMPDLELPFLYELQSVPDLSRNPLMLSLLCSLYRAQGHIPTNRLTVYRKCAELLFWRWDRQRQIMQNEDVPDYGDRLMQQIALLIYSHATAQGGVEEGQLAKVISVYLQDQVGSRDADRRAQGFLDFCAGRAWLLVKVGTSPRGVPLFNFAHRTFLEFFAAEGLTRKASDVNEVTRLIRDAYRKDGSSLVPELLIQSYDYHHERGATRVFNEIQNMRIEPDLTLRLMNASISESSRSSGFDSILRDFETHQVTQRSMQALVDLHEVPRNQFISDYLIPGTLQLKSRLTSGWAQFVLTGRYYPRLSHWQDTFDGIAPELYNGRKPPLPVLAWGAIHGLRLSSSQLPYRSMLIANAFDTPQLGLALQLLADPASTGATEPSRTRLIAEFTRVITRGGFLTTDRARSVSTRLNHPNVPRQDIDLGGGRELALSIALLFAEIYAPVKWLNAAIWTELRYDIDAMYAVRTRTPAAQVDTATGNRALRPLRELNSSWIRQWLRGELHLVH